MYWLSIENRAVGSSRQPDYCSRLVPILNDEAFFSYTYYCPVDFYSFVRNHTMYTLNEPDIPTTYIDDLRRTNKIIKELDLLKKPVCALTVVIEDRLYIKYLG